MPLLMLRPGPTRALRRARPRARSLRSLYGEGHRAFWEKLGQPSLFTTSWSDCEMNCCFELFKGVGLVLNCCLELLKGVGQKFTLKCVESFYLSRTKTGGVKVSSIMTSIFLRPFFMVRFRSICCMFRTVWIQVLHLNMKNSKPQSPRKMLAADSRQETVAKPRRHELAGTQTGHISH